MSSSSSCFINVVISDLRLILTSEFPGKNLETVFDFEKNSQKNSRFLQPAFLFLLITNRVN
ncbi:hypothetical protein CH378_09430 [Leptospira kmetyi]|uniref:Uncharacterized protein n=1 Tax=Leptospira kmetyi TaxID=408139 RepID=A0ABX4N9Q6_9LEPT|nr:hypothetical protein CH378_09430 [Leptospira kmetyi]